MIDIAGKYQASVFGNLSEIVPSPEIISKMLALFRDRNLLPGTFREISAFTSGPQVRLRLSSSNNEWNINFGTHRIDIEKNPTEPKGKNLGTVEAFTEEACEFFGRILTEFKKGANRISLITSGLLKEMTDKKLHDIYHRLFKPIKLYKENPPFEWNSRTVTRISLEIGSLSELINVITNINRIRGHLTQPDTVLKFDRIEVGFDINTTHENQDTRFDIDSVKSFYFEATELRKRILSDLEVFLNV